MYTYKCLQCGIEFQNKNNYSKFCSQKCCKEYSKQGEYKVCCYCGKKCYVPRNKLLIHKEKQFCSLYCSRTHQKSRRPVRMCLHCGKNFRKKARAGAKYCSSKCRLYCKENIKQLAVMRKKQTIRKINKLEALGYRLLGEIGIEYEEQYIISGRFVVDAFVPKSNTIIQFDGDYWYGNKDVFKSLSDSQKKQFERDRRMDKIAVDSGFRVLRIWENDLKKDYESVKLLAQSFLRGDK